MDTEEDEEQCIFELISIGTMSIKLIINQRTNSPSSNWRLISILSMKN